MSSLNRSESRDSSGNLTKRLDKSLAPRAVANSSIVTAQPAMSSQLSVSLLFCRHFPLEIIVEGGEVEVEREGEAGSSCWCVGSESMVAFCLH
jgi:hypothetical protein